MSPRSRGGETPARLGLTSAHLSVAGATLPGIPWAGRPGTAPGAQLLPSPTGDTAVLPGAPGVPYSWARAARHLLALQNSCHTGAVDNRSRWNFRNKARFCPLGSQGPPSLGSPVVTWSCQHLARLQALPGAEPRSCCPTLVLRDPWREQGWSSASALLWKPPRPRLPLPPLPISLHPKVAWDVRSWGGRRTQETGKPSG